MQQLAVISGDTGGSAAIQRAKDWIQKCGAEHKNCSIETRKLPNRVLDINADRVRLYETDHEIERYACLSHCWGGSRPACQTTTGNYAKQKEHIEWGDLPKTFQHAILVCRALDIRYLWIDSIVCIDVGFS
jgi:hypothetical protein